MSRVSFAAAIDQALAQAMEQDPSVVVLGEDVHLMRGGLFVHFGAERVISTPISEAGFVGAAVGAAMTGLRPVVEVMLVDFIGVAMDPILNHAAKLDAFSGGRWQAPMVIRAACGGGYGDGGQHEQSLWGWLGHIPGLAVVVPSTPEDAAGLMLAAIEAPGPVVFLEHKLLAETWLEAMGTGGRGTVELDVPEEGASARHRGRWEPVPIGTALVRRPGDDVTFISVGVGVHRCLDAADALAERSVAAEVLDMRSVSPLDRAALVESVTRTGRVVVVDEDYREHGFSGEIAASLLEAGLRPQYRRVCCDTTIPYARALEASTLPDTERILAAAREVLGGD